MRFVRRFLLAVPFTAALLVVIGNAVTVGWAPVPTKVTKKVDGKDVTTLESVGHYTEHIGFWAPLILVAALCLLVAVMLYVASDRIDRIPGAILGTLAAVVLVPLLAWVVTETPEHLLGRGTHFAGALVLALLLVTLYGLITSKRWPLDNTD